MARPRAFDEDVVLDRALNLFWHRGYEATSMQNLVDALGINRASLYDSFGDKYQLYRRVLDRYRQQNQAFVQALFDQPKPAIDLVQALFDRAIDESVADCDCKGCFLVNSAVELAPHDTDIAQLVIDNQTGFVARFQQLIERGQQEGSVTTAQPATDLALFLYNTYTGIKVLGKSKTDRVALESVVTVAMRVLHP